MAKILVSDSLAEEGRRILEADGANEVVYKPDITPEQLVDEISDYEALVIRSRTKVTADVLRAGKNLKIVGRAGVGVDNVDIPVATECGIIVANAPGGNTISTCEHAISLLMSLVRHVPEGDATMKAGKWEKKKLAGVEIFGKNVAVVGLGRIGREVAKRMKAFETNVWGYDPFVSTETAERLGISLKTMDEIIKGADIITIHTPKTAETTDLIGAEEFKTMKKTALVVNCARGGIINEDALAEALENGEIAGAAVDVYTTEPLPEDHKLRKAPNIVLTPHLGASTGEAQEKVAVQVAEQVVNAVKGAEVTTALNAPSINPEVMKQMKPHMDLAESLGCMVVQMGDSRIKELEISVAGKLVDQPTEVVTMSVMKGFLEHISDEPVNFINVKPRIEAKGVGITESRKASRKDFQSLITVTAKHEDGAETVVSGTVFEPDRQRIVGINQLIFEMEPSGNIILVENRDTPGIIGSVGTALANAGYNIGEISWGRDKQGGRAMTAINVDEEVTPEIVKELTSLPNILSARHITLPR